MNAQIMINTERALIEVDLTAPSTHFDSDTGEEIEGSEPNDYDRYGICIVNCGRTVARIISYKIWSDCFDKDCSRDKFTKFTEITTHILLGANKSDVVGNFDMMNCFADSDWPDVQSAKKRAMLRIDVRYEDVIREQTAGPHQTSVVFMYDAYREQPERPAQYNEYS